MEIDVTKVGFDTKDVQQLETELESFHISSKDLKNQEELFSKSLHNKIDLNLQNDEEAISHLEKNENFLLLKLSKLNLSLCNLVEVSNVIFKFKYLTVLNLSNNSIQTVPNEIKNLQNLTLLNLSGNNLTCLPKTMKNLHQLIYLNLSNNKLLEVPKVLYFGLRNIKILDLSFNEISTFRDSPGCLTSLIDLRISNNSLESLPFWIFNNICQLEVLLFNENPINFDFVPVFTYFGSGIINTLCLLNIENCNFTYERLEFLTQIVNLEVLFAGNNLRSIRKNLPKNYFGNLKIDIFKNSRKIKCLFLEYVQISFLPSDFGCLKSLEFLNLSVNSLSWLPESFSNLTNLKVLNLSSNQLLFLPNDLDKLVNLEQIYLHNNQLWQLPDCFSKMFNLEFIDLYNNKLENIDVNIFLGKKLKGIDIGLNCIDLSLFELNTNIISKERYDCLKNYFRKQFDYLNTRTDFQMAKKQVESINQDSSSCSSIRSVSIGENEMILDTEDTACDFNEPSNINMDDNWESSSTVEGDDLFDPSDVNYFNLSSHQDSWYLNFYKNYCPANSHLCSVKRTYLWNMKSASACDSVLEGQFDSD